MDKHFNIRNPRVEKGVRIEPAKKAQFKAGTINSVVKDIDDFMALHTTGGKKRSTQSKNVSVPTDALLGKGARSAKGKIKARFKPKVLYKKAKEPGRPRKWGRHRKPKPFVFESKYGRAAVIAQRKGDSRLPIDVLYVFHPTTDVKKTWPFYEDVEKFVDRNTDKIFSRTFNKAVASAR